MYDAGEALSKQAQSGMLGGLGRPASLKEQLEGQLQSAQQNVSRLQELIQLLDAHPEVNRIMELLGQRY